VPIISQRLQFLPLAPCTWQHDTADLPQAIQSALEPKSNTFISVSLLGTEFCLAKCCGGYHPASVGFTGTKFRHSHTGL